MYTVSKNKTSYHLVVNEIHEQLEIITTAFKKFQKGEGIEELGTKEDSLSAQFNFQITTLKGTGMDKLAGEEDQTELTSDGH